jgi:hypothetical protein
MNGRILEADLAGSRHGERPGKVAALAGQPRILFDARQHMRGGLMEPGTGPRMCNHYRRP